MIKYSFIVFIATALWMCTHSEVSGEEVDTRVISQTFREAISRCWDVSALLGAPNPENLLVELEIHLNSDGTLSSEPIVLNANAIEASNNQFWIAASEAAVEAVKKCQPYDFLPQDSYEEWKVIQINFIADLQRQNSYR